MWCLIHAMQPFMIIKCDHNNIKNENKNILNEQLKFEEDELIQQNAYLI